MFTRGQIHQECGLCSQIASHTIQHEVTATTCHMPTDHWQVYTSWPSNKHSMISKPQHTLDHYTDNHASASVTVDILRLGILSFSFITWFCYSLICRLLAWQWDSLCICTFQAKLLGHYNYGEMENTSLLYYKLAFCTKTLYIKHVILANKHCLIPSLSIYPSICNECTTFPILYSIWWLEVSEVKYLSI